TFPDERRVLLDATLHSGPPAGVHRGGPGARPDPQDTAQLAAYPVSAARVLALFRPHRLTLLTVLTIIVTASLLGLATPFLAKAAVDDAIPHQDVRLLLMLVGAMIGVAALTAVLGVVQT